MNDLQQITELVVLVDGSEVSRTNVRRCAALVHVVSSRLLVVRLRRSAMTSLRAIPGVVEVCEDNVPDYIKSELNEAEALFVAAWETQPMRSKERAGELLKHLAEEADIRYHIHVPFNGLVDSITIVT